MTLGARLEFSHVILIFVNWILIIVICVDHNSALLLISIPFHLLLMNDSFFFYLFHDISLPVLLFSLLCRSDLSINQSTILNQMLGCFCHRFLKLGLRVFKINLNCLYWPRGQGSTLWQFVHLNNFFVDTVRTFYIWQGFSWFSDLKLKVPTKLFLLNLWI